MSSGFVFKTMYKITPSGCNEVDKNSVASKLVASNSVLMSFSFHRASKWYPLKHSIICSCIALNGNSFVVTFIPPHFSTFRKK